MKDETVPTTQEEQAIREIVEYRCKALVDEGYDFEPLIQAFAGHQKQEIAKARLDEIEQANIVATTDQMTIRYMRGALARRIAQLSQTLKEMEAEL